MLQPDPLSPRDRHLLSPGPKRILSLDGGGTRGIITIAFLERIEAVLRERHGNDPAFRLSDYFDLIGGTSTGAIIAAGLALGMSASQVKQLYLDLAPIAFRRVLWRIWGWQARFAHAPLMRLLRDHLGMRPLDSPDLLTGLAVVAKRLDTGSPWLISNNPRAPYWADPADRSYVGNHAYDLATVVRASTAAPMYFRPERLAILAGEPHGLFVDGGVSPHNNPALMLLMLARLKAFGLCWPAGADRLLLISVGTGRFRLRLGPNSPVLYTAATLAGHALAGLIGDSQEMTMAMLQWMSEPAMPWLVNSEVGALEGDLLASERLMSFQRYDVELERGWLQRECGADVPDGELAIMRQMDRLGGMQRNYELATVAAGRQVRAEHLPAVFDLEVAGVSKLT